MAEKTELKKLGQFFHDIRTSRGITLKEAAGTWSQSNLSRFERGEQDLSTDKAVDLMARLGFERDDFYHYYETRRGNFPNIILNYALSYDQKFVEEWQASYDHAHPEQTRLTDYAGVMFDVALHWHDPNYVLTPQQEQLLADELAVPERFAGLETDILKLIVGPASHELRLLLKKRIERLDSKLVVKRDMRLLIVWLGALMAHDLALADALQQQLAPIFNRTESSPLVTQYYSNWQFGQLAYQWLLAPTPENEQAMITLIDDLLAMNNRDDAFWFRNMLTRMQHDHVHHHLSLVDHPQALLVSHNVAEVIQHQRQYLGVSISDVTVGKSRFALSRFEAGETQLGFNALVTIMGNLGLMPSQVLAAVGETADQAHGGMGVWPVYLQISKLNFQAAQQKYQQFALQVVNMPIKVQRMQKFILSATVAGLVDADTMKANAQLIANELLKSNVWYRMELLGFQAVVNWLPASQLQILFHHSRHIFEQKAPIYGVTTYFFEGLNKALVHIVKTESNETSQRFVQEFKWMTRKNTETPGAWLATDSWLIADALTAPTNKKLDKLQQYLQRSLRVGHVEAIAALKADWQGLVPPEYFEIKQG